MKFVNITYQHALPSGPKVYGRVRRGGRVFFRKYGREIKGGLSFNQVMQLRLNEMQRNLLDSMEMAAGISNYMIGKRT